MPFQEVIAANVTLDNQAIPGIVYSAEDLGAVCGICNESFEKYWDEVEEEWMFRNAIKSKGIFHFTCQRDNNNDTSDNEAPTKQETKIEVAEVNVKKRKLSDLLAEPSFPVPCTKIMLLEDDTPSL